MMTMTRQARTLTDGECQASATDYLRNLIGAPPDDLMWDDVHHLQGHARCSGREIIVIAARDTQHHTLVLTLEDWETIRHADSADRRALLRDYAIESHTRLLEVLKAA
jgi:hypothetical protein